MGGIRVSSDIGSSSGLIYTYDCANRSRTIDCCSHTFCQKSIGNKSIFSKQNFMYFEFKHVETESSFLH